jgi:hypothetical protein
MSEWWTYSLSDFLLFSPRTYYRLFELYNLAIWPAQLLALALGVLILALLRPGPVWKGRVVAAVLATCWLWVAWAYFLERYETINWAASYFAAAFAVEAALLIWVGGFRQPGCEPGWARDLCIRHVPVSADRPRTGTFLGAVGDLRHYA